jgi:hypothetical protein
VPKVFVSSVGGALSPYRQTVVDVCHRLALVPLHMEEFGPGSAPPLDACLRRVDDADVYVLLLAHRAGQVPPGETSTYTELEYERAVTRRIPVRAFVVRPDFPWAPSEVADPDAWRVRAFADRVGLAHRVRAFGDLAAFREDVLLALAPFRAVDGAPPGRTGVAVPRAYVARHPFVGRAEDLRVLDAWAASGDSTLVVESIGGVGKTALTWHWATTRGERVAGGRTFWWSFYGGSASMRGFLQELAASVSDRAAAEVRKLPHDELLALVTTELDARRHLVVLDGLERLLRAYHRFDPSALHDHEVDTRRRTLIEGEAAETLRALVGTTRSKVLVTTRLMPRALETPARTPLVGVRHHALPGLTPADAAALVARLGVRGGRARIAAFFDRLGNHPLLIGVVAGQVNDYRRRPGDFDAWRDDPAAGGSLRLADLDLAERRTHVLAAALRGLDPDHRRVLGWLAVLSGAVPYATVEAVNPFVPAAPKRREATGEEIEAAAKAGGGVEQVTAAMYRTADAEHRAALAAFRGTAPYRRATNRLDRALADLEDRGLLLWDRATNTYDLHPVVRAVARDLLGEDDRVRAHESVRDHFGSLPRPALTEASSVEELGETLTVFRSLVGCGCWTEALLLYYSGLGHTLRDRLAAYATIVELLEPFETADPPGMLSTELCTALTAVGRHAEAVAVGERALARGLDGDAPGPVLGLLAIVADACLAGLFLTRTRAYLDLTALPAFDEARAATPTLHLTAARLAFATGDVPGLTAHLALLEAATTTRPDLAQEAAYLRFALAHLTGENPEWDAPEPSGALDARAVHLRLARLLVSGSFELARESAAELVSRLDASGCDVAVATATLAWLETDRDPSRAAELVDEVVRDLEDVEGRPPFLEVALALCELDRDAEAVPYLLRAYRHGWGDGPPNTFAPVVDIAGLLLRLLGTAPPDLPVVDPVPLPLRNDVLAFAERVAPAVDRTVR